MFSSPAMLAPTGASEGTRSSSIVNEIAKLYAKLETLRDQRRQQDANPTSGEQHLGGRPVEGDHRVILVSRQLPFTLDYDAGSNAWQGRTPSDVETDQAMRNLQVVASGAGCKWVGWPRVEVDPAAQPRVSELLNRKRYFPVWVDEAKNRNYYRGFCKTVLWPLFHSLPPTTEDTISISRSAHIWNAPSVIAEDAFNETEMWQAYMHVNQLFADVIRDVYEEGDVVWVHDYHLMLVPQMVRNLLPNARIGFFLHVPFPSSELYRILPYREEILQGILAADLVGFQTYHYARYFLQTCESILGLDWSPVSVQDDHGHFANVCITPVGIEPTRLQQKAKSKTVSGLRQRYEKQFRGKKVVLGVDSIDVTKGLARKFLAIEEFLRNHSDLVDKVAFVQVLVGRSMDSSLEAQISRIAARINSQYCELGQEGPLHLIPQGIPAQQLTALYCVADLLLITPIRDGMNVVPFEYVIARDANRSLATVALSEFAGCARSLGGATLLNPWHTEHVASVIYELLFELEDEERKRNHDAMNQYVRRFTSLRWWKRFTAALREANEEENQSPSRELHLDQVLNAYEASSRKLIVVGLEGVLVPPSTLPELLKLPSGIESALATLCDQSETTVVIVSPRSCETMENVCGDLNAVLVAESGWFVRWGRHMPWECQVSYLETRWRDDVEKVVEYYTERTPGSFMETKSHSIAWHFRDCDLGHGAWQAKQLLVSLTNISKTMPFKVHSGNKTIEIEQQSPAPPPLLQTLLDRIKGIATLSTSMSALSLQQNHSSTHSFFGATSPASSIVSPTTTPQPVPPIRMPPSAPTPPGISPRSGLASSGASVRGNLSELAGAASSAESAASAAASGTGLAVTVTPGLEPDFVLVVLRGDDPSDEDTFEDLAPEPVDLDDFLHQLQLEQEEASSVASQEIPPALSGMPRESPVDGVAHAHRSGGFEPLAKAVAPGKTPAQPSLPLTPTRARTRMSDSAVPGGELKRTESDVSPLVASSLRRNSVSTSNGLEMVAHSPEHLHHAANPGSPMRPSAQAAAALNRRSVIYRDKTFAPRKDFPPTQLLFQAMRRKYGPQFSRYEMPETAAACWSLVRNTQVLSHLQRAEDLHNSNFGSLEQSGEAARRLDGGIDSVGSRDRMQTRSKMILADPILRRIERKSWSATLAANLTNLGTLEGSSDDGRKSADTPVPVRHRPRGEAAAKSAAAPADAAGAAGAAGADRDGEREAGREGARENHSLPINTFSVSVGMRLTQAHYFLKNRRAVNSLFLALGATVQEVTASAGPTVAFRGGYASMPELQNISEARIAFRNTSSDGDMKEGGGAGASVKA